MSSIKSLPSAPSLEYERKEAKALLKQIRAGDADALSRMRSTHPIALRDRTVDRIKLADAQHVIAREYGFTSWPRMVEYFEELDRHRNSPRANITDYELAHFEAIVQGVVRRHQRGDVIVARELAHFVPRFYALPTREILSTPITESEARLVVARQHRQASWLDLIDQASASHAWRDDMAWSSATNPKARAHTAIRNHDVDALAAILDGHPELLTPSKVARDWRATLAVTAIDVEVESKSPEALLISGLLASRGVNVQRELDERLLGWRRYWARVETVQWYLDRGANPNWMPPNGITVLEHAIVRYENGACVDLIAERVTPRTALWIAAGLGDAAGVRRYIAGKGKLKADARRNRPDLMAMDRYFGVPTHHESDDLEIMWEAFRIAGLNGRWAVMDVFLEAGLPVDCAPYGFSLAVEAIGNRHLPLAEYLINRGANLDREWGWPVNKSGRGMARSSVRSNPLSEDSRRLLSLCNAGAPEDIAAEMEAQRQAPPSPLPLVSRAMQLSADDAARQGQPVVTTENMLVGLLRVSNGIFADTVRSTGTDMPALRKKLGSRLLPDTDPLVGQELPADAAAAAAVQVAATESQTRGDMIVGPHHFLVGILSQKASPGAELLANNGADAALLIKRMGGIV